MYYKTTTTTTSIITIYLYVQIQAWARFITKKNWACLLEKNETGFWLLFYHFKRKKSSIAHSKSFIFLKINYRIRVNKPPAVYKKIKVLSWWFIEIFPKFDQKSPKKWTFWVKKWWFIWILYKWRFNQEWWFNDADTVIKSVLSIKGVQIFLTFEMLIWIPIRISDKNFKIILKEKSLEIQIF